MCSSLTSALQSRLHRHGIDVVRRDQPQSPRRALLPHLSNAGRAFHREFGVTQNRYNPRTGAFERVPERSPTQIVPARKQSRASWISPGNKDGRGSRGIGTGASAPKPSQKPRRRDYRAEDVEDRRRYKKEQARRNARQNHSHRRSHAHQYQHHPRRRTSATYSLSSSSSGENITMENRSPSPRSSTSHGYASPSPSPTSPSYPHSPPCPYPGCEREEDSPDDDWQENTTRSRRSVRFASFHESRSGMTYDGADVLERTPRGGRRDEERVI